MIFPFHGAVNIMTSKNTDYISYFSDGHRLPRFLACSRLRDSGENANWETSAKKRVPFLFAPTLLSESLEQATRFSTGISAYVTHHISQNNSKNPYFILTGSHSCLLSIFRMFNLSSSFLHSENTQKVTTKQYLLSLCKAPFFLITLNASIVLLFILFSIVSFVS